MGKFKKPERKRKNTEDEAGKIAIRVFLIDEGKCNPKKGNMIKSLYIENAKVSEVVNYLEKVLFQDESQ